MNYSSVQKSQLRNGKALTKQLIFTKTRNDNLTAIKNLNLWGNDLEDLSLLDQMPNLQVISLSVNNIRTLKYFKNCQSLQELYLRKNDIRSLSELDYIMDLQQLKVLWLHDNPCANINNYRQLVLLKLPNLTKLDNDLVSEDQIRRIKDKCTIGSNRKDNPQIKNVQISRLNSNQQQSSIKPLVPKVNNLLVNLQQNQSSVESYDKSSYNRKTNNINVNINQSSPTKVSSSSRNQFSYESIDNDMQEEDFHKFQKNTQERKPQINTKSFIPQKGNMNNSRTYEFNPHEAHDRRDNQQKNKYTTQQKSNLVPKSNDEIHSNYSSIKKDQRIQSSPISPSSPQNHINSGLKKKSNILMAVLALVQELDSDSLQIVRRQVNKKCI